MMTGYILARQIGEARKQKNGRCCNIMTNAVNCYLIDDEIISATIIGWHGKVTKMPREKFENSLSNFSLADDINKDGGIYFLLGNGKIYVGQADVSESDKGRTRCISTRVSEHKKEDFWDEVIMVTSGILTANDLNFLENAFFKKIKKAGVLGLNQTEPHLGKVLPATSVPMENFIRHVEIIFKVLGINFLTPPKHREETETKEHRLLHMKSRGANANGIIRGGKFIVLKGSRVALTPTPSCLESTRKNREEHKDKINADGELLEDISFDSPSGASNFVCFASTDGYDYWKYEDENHLQRFS